MNAQKNYAQIAAKRDPFIRTVIERMEQEQREAGRRLAGLRKRRGYTQPTLSTASGVSIRTIQSLEGGDVLNPRPTTIERLAGALKVKPHQLRAIITPTNGGASTDVSARLDDLERAIHELRAAIAPTEGEESGEQPPPQEPGQAPANGSEARTGEAESR